MKKYVAVSVILLIISILLITTSNANFIVGMNIKANSETIKVGDEETLTLSLNEKIIASNFEIAYDSTIFTLVGSGTNNLSVAERDGKIACIYADISGNGTKELSIKFKAKKETTTAAKFTIENAKFRAEGQETSYTGTQISGIDKALEVNVLKVVEPPKDNTTDKDPTPTTPTDTTKPSTDKTTTSTVQDKTVVSSGKLPNTGVKETTGYILMACSILLIMSAIFKYKEMSLAKLFKSGGVMVIALTILAGTLYTTKVYATENIETRYNDNLINEKKTLGVMISKTNTNRKITKAELSEKDTNVVTVTDKAGNTKADTDLIKTGDKATINNEEYVIVVYGDANGDGIVGDTDDIMVIIKDYLGIEKLENNEYKLAANLANLDQVLDTDDLMQMINNYLGKLTGDLVTSLPASTITNEPPTPEEPETPETPTLSNLYDVAEIGDFVDYPIQYTNVSCMYNETTNEPCEGSILPKDGWVILKKESDVITLLSAGTPENLSSSTNNGNIYGYLKEQNYVYNTYQDKYLDSKYAIEATTMISESDFENLKYKQEFWAILFGSGNPYASPRFWVIDGQKSYWDVDYVHDFELNTDYKIGLKVKVELKRNILTSGKNENGAWTLVEPQ